ncbi:MAG: sensor histidine kinase [Alphaproteobacteria bacterium]|nr:MAG: sensor histidine kinase [Alphaproteobacteria bacterium]
MPALQQEGSALDETLRAKRGRGTRMAEGLFQIIEDAPVTIAGLPSAAALPEDLAWLTMGWLGFGVLALSGLALFLFLAWRRERMRRDLAEARRDFFHRLMSEAPVGYLLRDPNGRYWLGPALQCWLDAERPGPWTLGHLLGTRRGGPARALSADLLKAALTDASPQEEAFLTRANEAETSVGTGNHETGDGIAREGGGPWHNLDVQHRPDGSTIIWLCRRTMENAEDILTAEAAVPAAGGHATASLEWRDLAEATPCPTWLRNEDGRLIAVNAAYAEAVEADSPADVLARQIELISEAISGSSRRLAREVRESGKAAAERHFGVIGGERRALLLHEIPLSDGKTGGFAVDITEAEDLRAELARLRDSHAETLDRLSTPVAIFDAEQRLRFFNSAFVSLSRLDEDWLVEHPLHGELLDRLRERRRIPEQADYQSWKREQLALHQSLEGVEELWHLPDDTALRVIAQPHPMGGLLWLCEDVTDRLALERSYNTLIAVQSETLNRLHEAVAVYGADARLKLYNPAYAQTWGLNTDFLDGEPHFGEVLELTRDLWGGARASDGKSSDESWESLKNRLLGQLTARIAMSGRWHRPDGRVLDYAIVPLPDGRVLTTHVDVTDSVRIEAALRERNEALQTADRLKSEFVANMSYELRTPLNSIMGFAELLGHEISGTLNERQRDYLSYVLKAAEQLKELIDDILDLAVIEAGAMELNLERFDIPRLLEAVRHMAQETARKADIRLVVSAPKDIGEIEGDRRRLLQAIYNLVANGIKFTPPGGTVTIFAEAKDKDHVILGVSDTGVGIDEAERAHVFDKFYRGHPRGRGKGKGVGLGLALVRSFVELHRGRVLLESAPEGGTTVRCRLPRRQPMGEGKKRAPSDERFEEVETKRVAR